jgi:glycosyltransferase involved in cell wall biosynthesis
LCQRAVSFEVVVVVDGSTDDTAAIVGRIIDPRVRAVIHETPLGPNAARNRGIAEASGEWIACVDDDDLWAPQKLSRQLQGATEQRRSWVYTGAVHVDLRRRVHAGTPPPDPYAAMQLLPRYNAIPAAASNVMVRADLLGEVGLFDTDLPHLADWDLLIRLASAEAPACIRYPLVGYRLHGSNFSFERQDLKAELDLFEVRRGYPVDRCRIYRHAARLSLSAGRRIEAIRYLARAVFTRHGNYGRGDLEEDAALIAEHLTDVVQRRSGRPSRAARRRHERQLHADPHREWKALAQAWLEELTNDDLPS